jgi:predicted nucleic acid-binding protein
VKKIVIDSSVFISHFGKDGLTRQSKSFFQKISQTDTQIILPALVAAEVVVVLRQNGAVNLEKIFQIFSQMKFSEINRKTIKDLATFFKTNQSYLKTSDLIIAHTTKLNQATLVTWDKQLLKNNFCKTTTPKEYEN